MATSIMGFIEDFMWVGLEEQLSNGEGQEKKPGSWGDRKKTSMTATEVRLEIPWHTQSKATLQTSLVMNIRNTAYKLEWMGQNLLEQKEPELRSRNQTEKGGKERRWGERKIGEEGRKRGAGRH